MDKEKFGYLVLGAVLGAGGYHACKTNYLKMPVMNTGVDKRLPPEQRYPEAQSIRTGKKEVPPTKKDMTDRDRDDSDLEVTPNPAPLKKGKKGHGDNISIAPL